MSTGTGNNPKPHVLLLPGKSPTPLGAPGARADAGLDTRRGNTTHFTVFYDNSLGTNGQALADAVLATCETDFAKLQSYFGGITPGGLPFNIHIVPGSSGASHGGCSDTTLTCDAFTGTNADLERMLVVAEADEVFMAAQGAGWDCGASNGEGLSRVLATEAYPAQLDGFASGASWLDGGRPDFVSKTDPTDVNYVSTGCATLFINYLRSQIGFTLAEIVQAGGSNLEQTHANLTGSHDALDPFSWLLQRRFPLGHLSGLPNDNPFPITDPIARIALDVLVHLQDIGDRVFHTPHFAGTRGQSRRLEGFQINFVIAINGLSAEYMAHLQDIGDTGWTAAGAFVGTRGQSRRLEGFAIRLKGVNAGNYFVTYMAHLQDIGDTAWSREGQFCGTRGQSRRVEGMSVRIAPKILDVLVHLQDIGDQLFHADELAGTRGQSRRLEGFQLNLVPAIPGLSLQYMAHLQDVGDTPWVNEGQFVGTRGQSRRLEGFAIRLTGANSTKFDISYMAHLQDLGDSSWFQNGEFCGTRGQSRRAEGIRVKITPNER
jgi:uncharacterized protein YjdB